MGNKSFYLVKGLTVLSVALFGLLVCLKFDGFLTWSWWWVLAPVWVPFAFALLVVIFAVLLIKYLPKK